MSKLTLILANTHLLLYYYSGDQFVCLDVFKEVYWEFDACGRGLTDIFVRKHLCSVEPSGLVNERLN